MKKLLLAMALVPSLALAAERTAGTPGDPMADWVPPKVTNATKDKQEIQALFRGMESAAKKGDIDAAAELVAFPVTMMTDDSKGEAKGEAWSREKWTQVMKPFYDHPMKDMKVTHKPSIFLLTDSLATVDDVCTMTRAGKTVTTRNSMFVLRQDGKWRVKAMAEGGWGNMTAAPQGTASGAEAPAAPGAASPPAEGQGTGSGAQAPPERTTK